MPAEVECSSPDGLLEERYVYSSMAVYVVVEWNRFIMVTVDHINVNVHDRGIACTELCHLIRT